VNANHIIPLIYSEKYLGSISLLQVFGAFFLLTIILGSGINTTVFYAINKQKLVLYLKMSNIFLNIIIDFIFIPYYQALCAIINIKIVII
jgi:O-antigen/teichoic acid export membrane protein